MMERGVVVYRALILLSLVCFTGPALGAGHGYFGVSFRRLTDSERVVPIGVMVRKVYVGMVAQQAGLKPGQIVTQIDGVYAPDPPSAVALLAEKSAGEKVRLTVIDRVGGQLHQSSIVATLGEKPTPEFAKVMVGGTPCALSPPGPIRFCVGPGQPRLQPKVDVPATTGLPIWGMALLFAAVVMAVLIREYRARKTERGA